MKKTTYLLLALLILVLTSLCTACDDEPTLKEAGAETITIYIYDFEDWSNEYFINSIEKYNDNLNDGVEIIY